MRLIPSLASAALLLAACTSVTPVRSPSVAPIPSPTSPLAVSASGTPVASPTRTIPSDPHPSTAPRDAGCLTQGHPGPVRDTCCGRRSARSARHRGHRPGRVGHRRRALPDRRLARIRDRRLLDRPRSTDEPSGATVWRWLSACRRGHGHAAGGRASCAGTHGGSRAGRAARPRPRQARASAHSRSGSSASKRSWSRPRCGRADPR